MKNHTVNGSGINALIDDFIVKVLSVPFCPYHFVRTILSNAILSVYHFVHTILSVPFCPLPFCPRTGHTPDFILSTFWPPNSPDFNLVDYKVWSVMQEQVYQTTPIHDVNGLKQRLLDEWAALD